MSDSFCVIMTTVGSEEEAHHLADMLVTESLAACVQIVDIASCYVWQGKVCREPEHLLLIKTTASMYHDVEAAILKQHSYEIPEIIQLPVTQGLDRYLNWICENTQPDQDG